MEGKATVEFEIRLKWQDSRIKLTKPKISATFPCEEIWTPALSLSAGLSNKIDVYPRRNTSSCHFNQEKKRVEVQLEDPLMGITFIEPDIMQEQKLTVELPCQLQLSMYPFGRHMCNLTILVSGAKWINIKDEDYRNIKYLNGARYDFHLEKITAARRNILYETDFNQGRVSLTLHLVAEPSYHITNSFLPSSLMFLICYLSLFFPTACFSERIMVSLTALLVLVTLFSQATNTYVKTPYYKLIDVWYVVLIFLCFTVVVANALVNYLRVAKVQSQTDLMRKLLAAKRCNSAFQEFLAACFVALVMAFVLFSQDILKV
ncbi:gamma-aminobutyric acid receptor subunit beta-3-like [Eriocheir sinensis]|uniref:gamma-aminobutyric acid receptor subunit beta-3-like n=1 Tax=Eriocheir sinensis TaxID=95602 RepID=UPI0021C84EFC|nr:gamma-aminobutyric acid receptor subunit beta-3-like [Eriocheir sinensis]